MRRITRLLVATALGVVAFGVGTADGYVTQPRVAAPSLRFTTRPAAVSAVSRPKVAWTTNLVAKTTVCLLDGHAVKSCKSGLLLPALASGHHTFKVTVTNAGHKSVSGSVAWLTDLLAPSVPTVTGAPAGWSQTSVTLMAGSSTDRGGSGLSHYQHRNHVDVGTWSAPVTGSQLAISASGCTYAEFRGVDGAGNASAWSPVAKGCIDTTAPTLSPSGGSAGWSKGAVTISANASDAQSGVATVSYETSTNAGASWSEPTAGTSATISDDGTTLVRFQATDEVGNATGWTVPGAADTAHVDTTAPTLAPSGGADAWSATPVTVDAHAEDSTSAIASVQYETLADGSQVWSQPQTGDSFTASTNGTTLVRFRATDAAGNTSAWTVPDAGASAKLDTAAPNLNLSGGSLAWSTVPITITADAVDIFSGVASVSYEKSVDDGSTWSAPQAGDSVTFTTDGFTRVRFEAVDNVGNSTGWVASTATWSLIDSTPPTLAPSGGSDVWRTGQEQVFSNAVDSVSGIASVVYETSTDGGQSWSQPQNGGAVTLSSDGVTLVRFQATDYAGNTSAWTVPDSDTTVRIDTAPPSVVLSGGSTSWADAPVTITANATDTTSGVSSLSYETSTNGGNTWSAPQAGDSAVFSSDGSTEVRFEAVDYAGNSSGWVSGSAGCARIDTSPPMLAPNGGSSSWSRTPVTIRAGATDTGSGVASVVSETSTDGGQTWSQPQSGSAVTVGMNGTTLVRFQATDALGTTSAWTVPDSGATASVDTVAPTVTASGGSNVFTASPVTITATAQDSGSGVASVVYETSNEGAGWSAPQPGSSVTITRSGITLVRFQATDAVGNVGGWVTNAYGTEALIDTTPPTITVHQSTAQWTNVSPVASASVTDTAGAIVGSGVASVVSEFSTDGGQTWSSPVSGTTVTNFPQGLSEVRFQATDLVGNTSDWTTPITVQFDNVAPSVTVSNPGTGPEPVTISASATDDGSGVKQISYRTWLNTSNSWSAATVSSSALINTVTTLVEFQAVDNAGNASAWVEADTTAQYDNVPPTIAPSGWDPVAGQEPVTISANATDARSGVKQVWYRAWNQATNSWGSVLVGSSASIDTTATMVEFQAQDNAGNTSAWVPADTSAQLIDTTPPVITLAGGSISWTAGSRTITGVATDSLSGVASVSYELSTDGGATWSAPLPGSSVTVTAPGTTMVRFQATDNAGNASSWVGPNIYSTANIDQTPPLLAPAGGSVSWTSGHVTISAGATDLQAGLGTVSYETSTDGGSTWSSAAVGSSVVVSGDGITLARFRASDEVGNQSNWTVPSAASTAMIDLTPPTVSPSGGSLSMSTSPVTITANAGDTESGVSTTQYERSADDGLTWSAPETGSSVTVSRDGTTLVRFRAIDAVGNIGSWSVPDAGSTVVMDDPLTLTPSGGNGSGAWTLGPVTVSAGEQDSASADISVQYEISSDAGGSWSAPQAGDSATVSANGTTLVRFDATDDAGNAATWTIPDAGSTIDIDQTPPTVNPSGGGVASGGPITIHAGAADSGSGVSSVSYETSTDGGSTWSAPQVGDSVTVTAQGRTLVRFEATDNLGNTSDWSTPTPSSTALIAGGQVDIMLVVDRTGSMAGVDFTDQQNGLLAGLLPTLDPTAANVGMAVFPPDSRGAADVCSAQSNNSYNSAQALYTVVPLDNSYATSTGELVSSSPLVTDLRCLKPGGGTDYANALEAAEAELLADGRPGARKVIILLSDGAANTGPNCPGRLPNGTWSTSTDSHCTNPCGTGVSDAHNYQAAGVTIYTIENSGGEGAEACQNWTGALESPGITPQGALLGMASPDDFFDVGDPTALPAVLQSVAGNAMVP